MSRRLSRLIFAALLVLVTVLMLLPIQECAGCPDDKTAHFVVFGGLTLVGWMARLQWRWLLPGLVAYAALTEVAQGVLTSTRQADFVDWVADLIGIAIGVAVAVAVARLKRQSA